jgi:two-component system chemotaxis response regulator CheY
MRGLIVDDSRAFRLIFAQILTALGIDTLHAANGHEGLTQLERNPDIDLVLVDWHMPVMDGIEFITTVRQQRQYQHIRLMMVTTESRQEQVALAMQAGADEYVMKPFTKEVLMAKLSLLAISQE